MNPNASQAFSIFFFTWALLCCVSVTFFYFNRNATLKRQVFTPFAIFMGLLFLGFLFYTGAPRSYLYIAVPMVALATFLNVRVIRFCNACGRTQRTQNLFSPPKFCSKCSAPLEQ